MSRRHNSHTLDFLLLGGAGVLGWWYLKNHPDALANLSADVGAATGGPPVAPLLSPSVPIGTGGAGGTGSILTTVPGVPLNSPAQFVGTAGGTSLIEETPVSTPDGDVWPSLFLNVNDPTTGIQKSVQIVAASPNSQTILANASDQCNDALFPGNNPTGLYSNSFTHLIDGLAQSLVAIAGRTDFSPRELADWLSPPAGGPGAVQYMNNLVRLTGYGADTIMPTQTPAVAVKVVRAMIAVVHGDSYFTAIPDGCFIQAWNLAFGAHLASL